MILSNIGKWTKQDAMCVVCYCLFLKGKHQIYIFDHKSINVLENIQQKQEDIVASGEGNRVAGEQRWEETLSMTRCLWAPLNIEPIKLITSPKITALPLWKITHNYKMMLKAFWKILICWLRTTTTRLNKWVLSTSCMASPMLGSYDAKFLA